MKDASIRVEGLWKRFRKGSSSGLLWEALLQRLHRRPNDAFWALSDVSLDVRPGEAVGVIGPNGAGKSTLLKVLSRILKPDRGRVSINGRLSGLIEVGAGFHGDLTGRENIFINGAILGMSRAEIRSKFEAIVEFAGIREFLDMPVKRYSSGMYVRLGFSVAAHVQPDVLLVDEVLSVGDVAFKARCMDAMRNFLRRGTSVLFVSHNLSAVKRFCDRVVLLDHGHVRSIGSSDAAIAEYSRMVSDLEDANPAGMDNAHIGGRVRSDGPAHITAVRILDEDGQPTGAFTAGRPLRLEIDYAVDSSIAGAWEPNFAVSVHMFGAGLFYQFESRRDGLSIGTGTTSGTVAVELPALSLGEGVYQIGVALADEKGLPEHDWHDRAYRITVTGDGITDGPVHQPRNWSIVSAAAPTAPRATTDQPRAAACVPAGCARSAQDLPRCAP